jgi:hypothetical protein
VLVDHPSAHVVDADVGAGADAACRERFEDQGGFESAEAATTVLLADIDTTESCICGLLVLVNREMLLLVPLGGVWLELHLRESVGHVLDALLIFVEELIVH